MEEEGEEQSAGKPEVTGTPAEGEPGRGQGEPEETKRAGETGIALAPRTTAQDGSGHSNKGELSKIKATKGKLGKPKGGSASKAVAKAVRDAKILAGRRKEGE